MSRLYYVYIITNKSDTLYIGVTNDLQRRLYQHQNRLTPGFSSRYNLCRLLYYETTSEIRIAITREKQLKGWRREKKMALIRRMNPALDDLRDTVGIEIPSASSGQALRLPSVAQNDRE